MQNYHHVSLLHIWHCFQLAPIFTNQFNMDFFIMVLSYAVPTVAYVLIYCFLRAKFSVVSSPLHTYLFISPCLYNNQILTKIYPLTQIKKMWRDIRECWSMLKNETERDIMQQYSSTGQLSTKLLTRMKIIKKRERKRLER